MNDLPPETARLQALHRLLVLDTPGESPYDDMTRMVADICQTPIALISLVDCSRQWFKSRVGIEVRETSKDIAFCTHAIQTPRVPMIVGDTLQDLRFVNNPLVTGSPFIRFYAGAPLVTSDGHAIGTLSVIDTVPRVLTAGQIDQLQYLSRLVVKLMERRLENRFPESMPVNLV